MFFLYDFDGKGTGITNRNEEIPNCGIGGNVVLQLCSTLPQHKNFKICANNYFTNFKMVAKLAKHGVYYVGTMSPCGASRRQSVGKEMKMVI